MKWLFSIIILIVLLGCSEEEVEEIIFEVVDKNIDMVEVVNCTMIGKVTSCRPKLVTKYYISSLDEQFEISSDLYNEIKVGKRYTIHVSEDGYIIEVLRE